MANYKHKEAAKKEAAKKDKLMKEAARKARATTPSQQPFNHKSSKKLTSAKKGVCAIYRNRITGKRSRMSINSPELDKEVTIVVNGHETTAPLWSRV